MPHTPVMTKLSLIAFEAERLLGYMPEAKRLALQQSLSDLCELHWHEMRGHEPTTPLAHVLWSTTPPLADLYADLFLTGDKRLDEELQGHRPAWGLALLAIAEIDRGDAQGARLAHEPMMLLASESAGAHYAAQMAALLHGRLEIPHLHKHAQRLPLWRALALITASTGRCDLKAVIEVIRLLADPATSDPVLKEMRNALDELGIRFLGIDEGRVSHTQHGHEHKPVTLHQIGDTLFELRQKLLG